MTDAQTEQALQNLIAGTASPAEIDLLRQKLAARQISIGGDASHSVIMLGDGNTDEKTEFWDAASGQLLRTLDGHFSRLSFSPDGRLLALGMQDGRIELWGLPGE